MSGSHWGFVASLVRPHRRAFVGYGVILAVATSLPIIGSLLIARFVELVVDGAPLADVVPYGIGYSVLGLGTAAMGVMVTWKSTQLAWRVTNGLRQDLAASVLEADLAFHRDRTPGELLTRCDADVTSLTTFLAAVVARVVGIALLAVSSTIVLAFVEPRMAPVLVVGYTVLGWTMWRVRDLSAEAVIRERTIDAEANSVIEQYVAGAEDVAALGAGAHGLRRFGEPARDLVDAAGERVRYEMRVQGSIKSVIAMVMVAVLVVGGIGIGAGWVDVAGVILAFRFVDVVRHPVEHLTWRLQEAQGVAGAARRIIELVDERSTVVQGTARLPDGPLDVRFDTVGLVYDDSHDGSAALAGLDLHLGAGRVLGLVGRTGSGKTTVARLCCDSCSRRPARSRSAASTSPRSTTTPSAPGWWPSPRTSSSSPAPCGTTSRCSPRSTTPTWSTRSTTPASVAGWRNCRTGSTPCSRPTAAPTPVMIPMRAPACRRGRHNSSPSPVRCCVIPT